ncbi:IucA/IucC family siderophore biosynthesis protein [Halobacillus sp. Marseille-Q1614]|uniref:IucA/IucC family protein n=1 Tax=Halobacillus sp. Marseille-Q1614 TaxID=2709134 RepID=UPI001571591B|nr:IucA/IucC family protein [Halobacillus sp. Marseille-Q1614]
MNGKKYAEKATIQSFLNCYLRETGNFEVKKGEDDSEVFEIQLAHLHVTIIASIQYQSITGRHVFKFPIYSLKNEENIELDYISLVALIMKELSLEYGREETEDELMLRVILSSQQIAKYLESREFDAARLIDDEFTFIEAEQSLLLGHLLHPTPKSKQGLSGGEDELYSPELKGEFQLHYFQVSNQWILQDSAAIEKASDQVLEILEDDEYFDDDLIEQAVNEEQILMPVHPLQAKDMLKDEQVQSLIQSGDIAYLGPQGSKVKATSSFRTVYREDSPFMMKFSVPIKITNSLRGNLQKELDRGVEVSRLLNTGFGDEVAQQHPAFQIIEDPAYIKLNVPSPTVAYDVVLRSNPFQNENGVSLIAGLCQEQPISNKTRLASIIEKLAREEERSTEQVSKDWFRKYVSLTVDPLLSLYEKYGLALEAHQQNSLIQLEGGYPAEFYYRDNQGYYFSESKAEKLRRYLPSLNEKSDTICKDDIAVERLRYYFFINHLFGLINSFGTQRLVKEEELLDILREKLQQFDTSSLLIHSLLNSSILASKANLLTRFYNMDELQGSLANQSVYTYIDNPLVLKAGVTNES